METNNKNQVEVALPYILSGNAGSTSVFDCKSVIEGTRTMEVRKILDEASGKIPLIRLNVEHRMDSDLPYLMVKEATGKEKRIEFDNKFTKEGRIFYCENPGIAHNEFSDLIIHCNQDFQIYLYTEQMKQNADSTIFFGEDGSVGKEVGCREDDSKYEIDYSEMEKKAKELTDKFKNKNNE